MSRGEGTFGGTRTVSPSLDTPPSHTFLRKGGGTEGNPPFVTREPHETHWSDIMIEIITEADYKVTLRTRDQIITCNVSDRIPLASFAEHAIIIPMLFEKETIIENLVCTSPVMYL